MAVTVSDLARSAGFYRDLLGLRLLFQAPPVLASSTAGESG
ncbi:MAG: VOC family protein [Bryobacteraceae bacterium]